MRMRRPWVLGVCLVGACRAASDNGAGLELEVPASSFQLQHVGNGAQVAVPFTVVNAGNYTTFVAACGGRAVPDVEQLRATWTVYAGGVCDGGNQAPVSIGVEDSVTSSVVVADTGTFRLVVSDSGYESPPIVAISRTFRVLAPTP